MPQPHQGLKAIIAANFSASASDYDHYAVLQQLAADSLGRRLQDIRTQIPAGPILEIGCGTGSLSKKLVTLFADRQLTLLDLAPGMIAQNRQALTRHVTDSRQIEWRVGDAESFDTRDRFALITSCLALQWFQDVAGSLSRLDTMLVPNGIHLCSFLGDRSFPEWRHAAGELGLPCTANPLPNGQRLIERTRRPGYKMEVGEESISITYPTVRDFFRSLKKTGTNTSTGAHRLTRKQMATLLNAWQQQSPGPVPVTYQIITLMVQRCG